jgi:hypothetical protein
VEDLARFQAELGEMSKSVDLARWFPATHGAPRLANSQRRCGQGSSLSFDHQVRLIAGHLER